MMSAQCWGSTAPFNAAPDVSHIGGKNMKRYKKLALAVFIAGTLSFGQASAAVQVNPIPGLPADFIKGADISVLPAMEKAGAKYYDVDGTAMDEIAIMQKHGVNWIRVRIWNDPKAGPGGGGNADEAKALQLAQRAKKLGMKVLIDFHYSDFWTDPNQQTVPKAWSKYDEPQLVQAVYDYTKKVMTDFERAGVQPDMVQIGNEISHGFLWPLGKWPSVDGGKTLSALLASGLKAVHDVDPAHKTKTLIHLPDGGDNALYQRFFDMLTKDNGVNDFDIIGVSYYPFWHGTLDQLQANINDISQRYNKDVIVVETAYGYTTKNFDQMANEYSAGEARRTGFEPTVQGQASGLRALMARVAAVPNGRGLGVFYWEPDWYAVDGVGWKTGAGNNWDNLAMFDKRGKALESWDVFRDVSDPLLPTVEPEPDSMDPLEVTGAPGQPVKLPQTAHVIFSDDHDEDLPIVWHEAAPVYAEEGTYTVNGRIEALSEPVSCAVTIKKDANLLKNGDFESLTLDGWTVEGEKWAVQTKSGEDNALGEGALHYWAKTPVTFNVYQELTDLPDGVYAAEVTTQGKGDAKSFDLYVIGDNGEKKTAAIQDSGWKNWRTVRIDGITIKGGKATVGIEQQGNGDNWGSIDNVKFYHKS